MEKEIEVKIKVMQEEFDIIRQALITSCGLPRIEHQHDTYFSKTNGFLSEKYPFEWLSIRRRNGVAKVCYKHFFPEGAEKHTHCNEIEVQIDSDESMSQLLRSLGYDAIVDVNKVREIFTYRNTCIGLDRVGSLGTFVEVEAIERIDVQRAIDAISEVVEELGLNRANKDHRGYPYRLLELQKAVRE